MGDGIQAARDKATSTLNNALARLEEILASPKPSYTIEGQSVSWTEYQKMLVDIISGSTDTINKLKQLQSQEPYEFVSRGV